MQHIARFFSTLLSPLFMPTYGIFLALWVSTLCYLPVGTRLTVLIVIFGITCILPIIFIAVLHSFGKIQDKQLNSRTDRPLPYIFLIICYIGGYFYMAHIHSPQWLSLFMLGGATAALLSCIVNFWWKISAHMAGIGGLVALLFRIHTDGLGAFELLWIICGTIILVGILGSSRIALKRHTFWQVIAGFANGFICVFLFN